MPHRFDDLLASPLLAGGCPLERRANGEEEPMPDVKNLNDLFVRTLRRIYDAEQRLTKALPKLEKSASSPELKQAFQKHLKETETHVERLHQLFGLFDQKPNADTS